MTAGRVLVLGGTAEARELAAVLAVDRAITVTTSLAGRLADPRLPAGEVRVGGFGGAQGLANWLRANEIDAVIDATHPFASTITRNAAEATAYTGVPFIVLHRPPWAAAEGDRWQSVSGLAEAAALVPTLGRRAFLTIGRQGVAAFADVEDVWFLVRSIEAPDPPLPAHHDLVLARGPFTVAGESQLLRRNAIDVVVTKNSGGLLTRAKLDAARKLGLPVLMLDRPPLPRGIETVAGPGAAVRWFTGLDGTRLSAQSG